MPPNVSVRFGTTAQESSAYLTSITGFGGNQPVPGGAASLSLFHATIAFIQANFAKDDAKAATSIGWVTLLLLTALNIN